MQRYDPFESENFDRQLDGMSFEGVSLMLWFEIIFLAIMSFFVIRSMIDWNRYMWFEVITSNGESWNVKLTKTPKKRFLAYVFCIHLKDRIKVKFVGDVSHYRFNVDASSLEELIPLIKEKLTYEVNRAVVIVKFNDEKKCFNPKEQTKKLILQLSN